MKAEKDFYKLHNQVSEAANAMIGELDAYLDWECEKDGLHKHAMQRSLIQDNPKGLISTESMQIGLNLIP